MGFKQAVESTPGLEQAYRQGLRAIQKKDRRQISCHDPHTITGSVNLDNSLAPTLPNDPIWDYGVGFKPPSKREKAVWIEIHPASSHHVDEVIRKLDWLKGWLAERAPRLKVFPAEFVWIASGSVALQPNSPHRRKIANAGLRLTSHLRLT